jgi:hypothetical protein
LQKVYNSKRLEFRKARFWRFASQNKDKKFNFAPKIGWRALAEGEPNLSFSNWRCVFEKIRTDFARDWLDGRNSPPTPV